MQTKFISSNRRPHYLSDNTMLGTYQIINPFRCNFSTNFIVIDRNSRYSVFSIQPCSNPPDHRLHSIFLYPFSYPHSFFSPLHNERFNLEHQASLHCARRNEAAVEDPGLEGTTKWKNKSFPYLASVVRVICTTSPGYFSRFRLETRKKSSGFIVKGRKVITCAHCVDHHTKVQIKKSNSDTLYVATVLAVALDCDLALLTVNDDNFWEGVMELEFGDVPAPNDKLAVLGYPNGKFSMITTSVSRVNMIRCSTSQFEHLCIVVDVVLKGGNSGGPVFNKRGKCVGMAFQSGNGSDILAAPVINHVLEDYYRNGAYTGFPRLAIVWQDMRNPDLRLFMKMGRDQQGVLIIEVKPNYPEYDVLKPNDIILSIDGIDIDNFGQVQFRWGQRIPFTYLLTQKYVGDTVHIKVLRNSEIHCYSIKLRTQRQLNPANTSGKPFPYYIIAGFVFTTLSVPYIISEHGFSSKNVPVEILSQALYEERVVIAKVLMSGTKNGYDDMTYLENAQVLAVNGIPVQSLKGFTSIIESCNEEYLEFFLDKQKKLVLHTASAKAITQDILRMHNITCAMGDDLKMVTWSKCKHKK